MFTIKKDVKEIVPVTVTVEQQNLMTDLYVSTKGNVTKTKHQMGELRVSSSIIKQEFAKKVEIFNNVKQVMIGKIIISAEESHVDEETSEIVVDKEVVYNTIPKTSTGLKTESAKSFDEAKVVVDYVVDKIIKGADGTDKCAWNKFKLMFEEVNNELVK